jgi:hypothetical protein
VEILQLAKKEEYSEDLTSATNGFRNWVAGEDGLLYQVTDAGRIVVPRRLRDIVLRQVHGIKSIYH